MLNPVHKVIYRAAVASFLAVTAAAANAQFTETQKLVPTPPIRLPGGAAVDGDWAVIPVNDPGLTLTVYERTGSGWTEFAQLENPNGDFGRAAISGNTIVVGSPSTDLGDLRDVGGLYVFEFQGGQWVQTQRIVGLPQPEEGDLLGVFVRIIGDTIFAGAPTAPPGSEDPPGKLAVYQRFSTDWSFSEVLTAPNPADGDGFPHFIHGYEDTVLVSSLDFPDDTSFQRTVHVLTRIGNQWGYDDDLPQPAGLDPDEGYGERYDIADGVAVVGAVHGQVGGRTMGEAYTYAYNGSAWELTQTLQPGERQDGNRFGGSVSIDGRTLMVGAYGEDGDLSRQGAVYQFELFDDTWVQVERLLTSDPSENDRFGQEVSFSGQSAMIFSPGDDDAGTDSGALYAFESCRTDTDGDGLCDEWETLGIPYYDINGDVQRYVLDVDGDGLSDADPMHKDLFVEVDVMTGVQFGQAEADNVISSFFVAPVDNPDDVPGITLHVAIEQGVVPFEQVTESTDGWPPDAQGFKETNFGTLGEQIDESADALLAAKAKAYRYCVVFHDVSITPEDGISIGGQAELPGDDMVLYLAAMDEMMRSSTFMHELGHNLGLGHGGGDHVNGKPNYPSIMNYTLVDPMPWSDGFWQLDYSREALAPIDEESLDELASVGAGGSGYYSNYIMPYFSIVTDGAPCFPPEEWGLPKVSYASLDPSATTDFNLDCDDTDSGIAVDLNFLEDGELPGSGDEPTPNEVLNGFNDWANIELAVTDGGGAFRGPRSFGELTDTQRQFIIDNFPPPDGDGCLADWNADGEVNTLDVLGFLNAWAADDSNADVNGDGYVNTLDVLAFLNAWAAGC